MAESMLLTDVGDIYSMFTLASVHMSQVSFIAEIGLYDIAYIDIGDECWRRDVLATTLRPTSTCHQHLCILENIV